MARVVGVRFRKACKVYDFNANNQEVSPGDTVIVEVDRGLGMGTVASEPIDRDESTLSHKLKNVIRKADSVDMERQTFNHERENEAYRVCKEKIEESGLEMKLIRVEYLFDSSKAIFYFTSEGRIDFRVLVKDLASNFHTRIEMRQIGVRDEAKVVGGIGPCGRELCCTSYLSNFAPVTVKMAKEQNLALNPTKISGICGRLMCCLSYEHRSYQKKGRGGGGPSCASGDKAKGGQRTCCAVPDLGTDKPKRDDKAKREGRPPRVDKRKNMERRAREDIKKPVESAPREEGKSAEGVEPKAGERPPRERRRRRRRRRRSKGSGGGGKGPEHKGPKGDGGGGSGGGGSTGGSAD
jgi:cell fate regulator YaaT (PSP1 superfamily)